MNILAEVLFDNVTLPPCRYAAVVCSNSILLYKLINLLWVNCGGISFSACKFSYKINCYRLYLTSIVFWITINSLSGIYKKLLNNYYVFIFLYVSSIRKFQFKCNLRKRKISWRNFEFSFFLIVILFYKNSYWIFLYFIDYLINCTWDIISGINF